MKASFFFFFFFNDTATTEIYTLSLHDALPISVDRASMGRGCGAVGLDYVRIKAIEADRKSTRLNSSHTVISYAVFCLKKKKKQIKQKYKIRIIDKHNGIDTVSYDLSERVKFIA